MMKPTSFLLLVLLLLTSCLGDDRGDCPQLRLTFAYQADGDDNVMARYVDNVTVVVFDEVSGRFITSFTFSREQLLSAEGLPIDLPDGDYRLVCWGNAGSNTLLNIGGDLATSSVGHPGCIDALSVPGTNDRLYYATTTVSVRRGVATEVHVDFTCAYITLEVYIRGLDAAEAPVVEVQHLTPQLDFRMQPVNPYSATYRPTVVYDATARRHAARLHVLRFSTDNPITLEILEPSGLSLYTLSLSEFMATHDLPATAAEEGRTRAIVTEGVQQLTIPIEIAFKGTDVTVSIPSWGSETVTPGMMKKREEIQKQL